MENIARIHSVSTDVLLLAASEKLTKSARAWFDVPPLSTRESWTNFKSDITAAFKVRFLYKSIMEKVDARKWNPAKESFKDYAWSKMTLLKVLRLADYDTIKYLVAGIPNQSLRGIAASLSTTPLYEFIEKVQDISNSLMEQTKRPFSSDYKKDKFKLKSGDKDR